MKVQSQKDQNRKSISHFAFSTPLSNSEKRCDNKKFRRSTSSLGSENSDKSPTNILFEMVMSDPKKKAFVERLLYEDRDKIDAYKKKEQRKNAAKNKRLKKLQRMLHCESPTALLRRRALESDKLSNKSNSTSGSDSLTSSPLLRARPFEKLLSGVIAYVEINSHGKDCSAGAKALMQTMGATVKDQFGPDVTHVIFKDGSYNTFKTAKLLKMHVVSVLWLEAVRKSNIRVPEKNYPALGAEYNNISQICQDYESVINEEYRRSLQILSQNETHSRSRKTAIPSELETIKENININTPEAVGSNICTKRRLTEIIPSSQGWECESIISYESGYLPFRKVTSTMNEDDDAVSVTGSSKSYLTSDSGSDCGVIDGHSTRRSSQPSQLDISLGIFENPQTSVNVSANTSSGRSTSLLARKSIQLKKSTCFETIDMDLTENLNYSNNGNISDSKQKNCKGKTAKKPLHFSSVQHTPVKSPSSANYDEKLLQKSYVNLSKDSSIEKTPTLSIPSENHTTESSISKRCSTSKRQLNEVSHNVSIPSARKRNTRSSKDKVQLSEDERFSLRVSSDATRTDNGNTDTERSSNIHNLSNASTRKRTTRSSKEEGRLTEDERFSLRVSSDANTETERSYNVHNISNASTRKRTTRSSKEEGHFTEDERFSLRVSSDANTETERSSNIHNLSNANTRKRTTRSSKDESRLTEDERFSLRVSSEDNTGTERSCNSLNVSSSSTRKHNTRSSKEFFNEDKRFSLRISSDASDASQSKKSSNRNSINSEMIFSLRVSSDSSKTSASNKESSSNKRSTASLLTEDTSTNSSKTSRRKTNSISGDGESFKSPQNLTNSEERFSLRISSENVSEVVNQEGFQEHTNAPSTSQQNVLIEESLEKSPENESQSNINHENTSNQNSNVSTLSAKNISLSRSKDDSYIPTKKPKVINENLTKSERKPRRFRKLYNVDQSYDDEVFKNWNPNTVDLPSKPIQQPAKPTTVTNKINELIKKTVVIPLTPIKITPLVKKLYDKTKSESKVKKQTKSKKKQKETPKATTTIKKKAQLDSSKDEQRELIDEYVNKKKQDENKEEQSKDTQPFKKPTSRRLFSPLKKLDRKENVGNKIVPRISRRSTLDFTEIPQVKKITRRLVHKIKNPSIVCTRLHRIEVENFLQIVNRLGYFFVEDEVTHKTTHLVVGEAKRTINLLRAIARGCWIVTKEWLFRSLEASKWLPEEDFELIDFSSAVQQCRMQRQAFGPLYSMDIFADCGPIYVGYNSIPRRSDLQELIELCKGVITKSSYNASVVVGDWVRHEGVTCVNEKWVLDSITFNKRKSFKNYVIALPN